LGALRALRDADGQLTMVRFTATNDAVYLLQNSSTNQNRKRTTYFLKRFFCDDLTPINVAIPSDHAKQAHASDPACVACHYKLDPLAGFFRNFGNAFADYSRLGNIEFDDHAVTDLAGYANAWRNPPGSLREWNVGYVRSLQFPEQNYYGESLDDLFAFMRQAPEVKACLVHRLNQYLLGEEQTVDQTYLDGMTRAFVQQSATDSTTAFRQAAAAIVTSQAFRRTNRDPETCYDFPPGTDLSTRPPCRIAAVVQRSCVSCHASESAAGGLDLSRWVPLSSGKYGFPHRRPDTGEWIEPRETAKRIVERLSSASLDLRMPLLRYMAPLDKEALYLWATEQSSHVK
jgi:mono/diheme cytochrome c family protein